MSKSLAALALAVLSIPTLAAAPATEAQWIAAATSAVAYARLHDMPIDLAVEQGNRLSGHTPIGLRSADGRCTLVVSVRDNPTADKLSSMIAPELQDVFLAGAAIHEVGHCYRRLNGYPHNEQLLPVVAWIAPVKQWFTRRILTEEVFADMTEVAWLARYHPRQFQPVMQEIVKVRTRFREPKHDTLPWLEIAMAEGPHDDGQNLFFLADKHLSKYR